MANLDMVRVMIRVEPSRLLVRSYYYYEYYYCMGVAWHGEPEA